MCHRRWLQQDLFLYEQNLLPTCFISGHRVPLSSCHPLMLNIPGFEVVVLGGGRHPSSLPRMVIVVLPLGFPIPDMSLLSAVLVAQIPSTSVGICGAERGAQANLLGPPAWPLLCPCAAGTLNVAMVIKAHSPRLPRKRSTTQIQTTIYGPVIFPKCSLFVRFKQGFILRP